MKEVLLMHTPEVCRKHAVVFSTAGILIVGAIDYLTGVEVRIFPLYFLPLVAAACHSGRRGAWTMSILATAVWMATMYLGHRQYSRGYIWGVNFFTQGTAFLVVSLLVADVHKALNLEQKLSRVDNLTGLSNSRSFHEKASAVLSLCHRNEKPVTLAYVDMDNFKRANDTHGHLYGDGLLKILAAVFHENLRTSDLSARMGGDEFVVLLPETRAGDAGVVLEKIRRNVEKHPDFSACSVTVSIGAISYSRSPSEIGPMIKSADDVMYKVKNTGRNRIIVDNIENSAR